MFILILGLLFGSIFQCFLNFKPIRNFSFSAIPIKNDWPTCQDKLAMENQRMVEPRAWWNLNDIQIVIYLMYIAEPYDVQILWFVL